MEEINKVKSISIWIFVVPFVAVNTCLILITQFHGLFPNQEDVLINTIPYFDGGASISRTARPYPSWLVFKPAMFLTAFLLIKYWLYNKKIIDFKNLNLHLVSYSEPMKTKITYQKLIKNLHFIKNIPNAIPYVTSYYKKTWGFCLSYNQYKSLKKKDYMKLI